MVSLEDAILLIGRARDDEGVQMLLQATGLETSLLRIARDDRETSIESEQHGIVLSFARSAASDLKTSEGAVFIAAHAMAGGVQGHSAFKGTLPKGLTFADDRKTVAQKLGKPDWSSPVLPIDRWNMNNIQLVIEFAADDAASGIDSVVVQRPR